MFLGEGTGVALDRETRNPWVWGVGSEGQLGLGGAMGPTGSYHGGAQRAFEPSPQRLQGEALLAAAALRHRTLLLSQEGLVYVTGSGFQGELGVSGTSGVVTSPASVVGLPSNDRVTALCGGLTFTLAATASGRLFFWGVLGHGGAYGTLSAQQATSLKSLAPLELVLPGREAPLRPLLHLAAGNHCALVSDGAALWALGASWGTGGFEQGVLPRAVPLPWGVRAVTGLAAGPSTVALVGDEATVWLAGRLDSPFLLGGEAGPSTARWLEGALAAGAAGGEPPAPNPDSRAALLEDLGLGNEIGWKGSFDGDGLVYQRGQVYSPRLVRVVDEALMSRRVRAVALGAAHGLVMLD